MIIKVNDSNKKHSVYNRFNSFFKRRVAPAAQDATMSADKIRLDGKVCFFCKHFLGINKRHRVIKWALLVFIPLFLTAAVVLVSIAYGMHLHKSSQMSLKEWAMSLAQHKLQFIPNYIKGLGARPGRIHIDIKYLNFQKLAYKRETAINTGILINTEADYVPARIRFNNKTIGVKIRLKGDWADHLGGDKWSFRIKTKGETTFQGMKQFSLHHPKTRNYVYEWIYHEALKREDVLALRYRFVDVVLNGKDLGIYALEEHFEKRLLEHNRRREGPIIRFNEDLWWDENLQFLRSFPNASRSGYGDYLSSDIDSFQTTKILANPSAYSQFKKAVTLLESFRRGELTTSKVFDIQKLAAFLAVADLMGAVHALDWINPRFYYNPVTSLLEPIGFDATSGLKIQSLNHNNRLIKMMLEEKIFQQEYFKTLERVSHPTYLDSLFREVDKELKENLSIIYSEYPYFYFDKGIFYTNQRYIKTMLTPKKGLHAYFHRVLKNRVELDLGNIQTIPIEVVRATYKNSVVFQPEEKNILKGKKSGDFVNYQTAAFLFPGGFTWADTLAGDLTVKYKLLGTNRILEETVSLWPYLDRSLVSNDIVRQSSNVQNFDFLKIDEKNKRILFKVGRWHLSQDLVIPAGYEVLALEGMELDLSDSARILSFSPLHFVGSEERPIRIVSTDSTGQGIVVIKAGQKSLLKYVVFENLSNPSQKGWELTGAVTFYESPVQVSLCQFKRNRCEDALNIIRSDFEISHTLFTEIAADAFDADFTDGQIIESSFIKCGNDAVDVSGSKVRLQHIIIDGAADKGLSAGEKSRMTAEHVVIKNSELAVSSKDLTEMVINHIKLEGCKVGFTAFKKKPEFGPASVKVSDLKMDNVEVPHLIEPGSTFLLDGRPIKSNRENLKDLLDGVKYGKSSR